MKKKLIISLFLSISMLGTVAFTAATAFAVNQASAYSSEAEVMESEFSQIMSNVFADMDASFYEDYYKNHPEIKQEYFSYAEYLEVDHSIAGIQDLGNYELELVYLDLNAEAMNLAYFNRRSDEQALNGSNLLVSAPASESLLQIFTIEAIPGLEGYSMLRMGKDINGFLYSYGETQVCVLINMLNTLRTSTSLSISRFDSRINSVDELINFIQALGFNEFSENLNLCVQSDMHGES